MPQMMPLNWILAFIFFILIFILFNIMNYYSYNINNFFLNKKKFFKKNHLNWKW